MHDIVVIGAGPAGMTAAIYARRAARSVLVLEAVSCGGQILNTPDIENYPVEAHISGFDFSRKLHDQAEGLGAEFIVHVTDHPVQCCFCQFVESGQFSEDVLQFRPVLGMCLKESVLGFQIHLVA